IAVDQLEMGYSERTGVTRRYQDRITDLSLLTDALSLHGPVVTAGHDWCGLISTGWALHNRHDVVATILAYSRVPQRIEEALPKALQLASTPGFRTASTSLTDASLRTTLSLSKPSLPKHVRAAYLAPYRSRSRRRGIDQFVADIPA